MSKYFNSIVTCHKSRRWALRAFLRAFSLAVKYLNKDSFEIVITDMDEDSDGLIDKYKDVLNINLCKVKYDGIFCRGRALNHAVLNAKGEYVTPIDIDSIISKHFLINIEKFYSEHGTERLKLCHRIKQLNSEVSLLFMFNNFEEDDVDLVISKHHDFWTNIERYTKDEIETHGGNISQEWLNGDALGTSQFTMLRSSFMKLGGYDESFIGYGCEDLDFNIRAYNLLGGGHLNTDPRCFVYHLENIGGSEKYYDSKIVKDNYDRYLSNKKNNIISLPISSQWGKF